MCKYVGRRGPHFVMVARVQNVITTLPDVKKVQPRFSCALGQFWFLSLYQGLGWIYSHAVIRQQVSSYTLVAYLPYYHFQQVALGALMELVSDRSQHFVSFRKLDRELLHSLLNNNVDGVISMEGLYVLSTVSPPSRGSIGGRRFATTVSISLPSCCTGNNVVCNQCSF